MSPSIFTLSTEIECLLLYNLLAGAQTQLPASRVTVQARHTHCKTTNISLFAPWHIENITKYTTFSWLIECISNIKIFLDARASIFWIFFLQRQRWWLHFCLSGSHWLQMMSVCGILESACWDFELEKILWWGKLIFFILLKYDWDWVWKHYRIHNLCSHDIKPWTLCKDNVKVEKPLTFKGFCLAASS